MGLLDNKVVIVTGGGRGLGRSHALTLARQGAVVVVNDVGCSVHGEGTDATVAEAVAEQIRVGGGSATSDSTSVTDHQGVGRLFRRTIEQFGRIDGVVNNAGIVRPNELLTAMTERDFDAVLAVHVKGTFNVLAHAALYFQRRWNEGDRSGGRVVNTTSGAGLRGSPALSYSTAKAGIAALTISAAMQLRPYGVTVNAISPVARTRMNPGAFAPASDAHAPGVDPLAPDHASALVAYLLSDAASWLTGQVLRVDGNVVRRYEGWKVGPRAYQGRGEVLEADELDDALRVLYGVLPVPYLDPANPRSVELPGVTET